MKQEHEGSIAKGCLWGILLSIPIWILFLYGIFKLIK